VTFEGNTDLLVYYVYMVWKYKVNVFKMSIKNKNKTDSSNLSKTRITNSFVFHIINDSCILSGENMI